VDDVHPASARWTHVALPCRNLDETLAWYATFTPLSLLDRRTDVHGSTAWLGHDDQPEHPFVLVFVCPAGAGGRAQPTLAPFAHLGVEVPTRAEVDRLAAEAREAGCLRWEPIDHDPPVGYVCALADPDGNLVEISHDQGVYAKAREVWGGS
jgi:catechol 2,3-dioxygenase-like lactoylglutathione lyase family enzyme